MEVINLLPSRLREAGMLPPACRALYVGGSVARGWSTETSDIDLYVVSAAPWPEMPGQPAPVALDPSTIAMTTFVVEDRRCDIEYWLASQVDQLLAKVSAEAYQSRRAVEEKITVDEEYLLERLMHALVLEDDGWLAERRALLRASAYRRIVAARALNLADNYVEDAVGQLRAADSHSAVLSARLAFNYTVDALLAGHGECGRSPKWRARRVRSANPPELSYDDYWAVETMRDFDPADPGGWAERIVRTCQRIAAEVAV